MKKKPQQHTDRTCFDQSILPLSLSLCLSFFLSCFADATLSLTQDATLALPTLVPTSPTNADSAAHPAARDAPPTGPRFAFGVARYIASLHVVLGHLNARGLAPSSVWPGFSNWRGGAASGGRFGRESR